MQANVEANLNHSTAYVLETKHLLLLVEEYQSYASAGRQDQVEIESTRNKMGCYL